jgi:hypothetical protein
VEILKTGTTTGTQPGERITTRRIERLAVLVEPDRLNARARRGPGYRS